MIPSFLPRRLFRLAARCMLALLFFAQGAMLAHACTAAERAAAFAATAEVPAHCHEAATDVSAAAAENHTASCLSHCSSADQSADTPQVVVHAMPAAAVLSVPAAVDVSACAGASVAAPPPTGDPPIAIRFQVFRT